MARTSQTNGYSSTVDLSLELAGETISLHAIGPDRITLREAYEAPPGPATVVMRVDGSEHRWSVILLDGLRPDSKVARTEQVAYHEPVEDAATPRLP
jgi:hypothetical protein